MQNMFEPLKPEDIQEKIDLNKKDHGYSLKHLREFLQQERFKNRRKTLELRNKYDELLVIQDIQDQNLVEQIAYIDKKIESGEE